MKIALLSDTHDNMLNVQRALDIITEEKVDAIIHAGDYVAPFALKMIVEQKGDTPFIGVFGNNDGEKRGLLRIGEGMLFDPPHEFTLADKRFYLTHDGATLDMDTLSETFDIIIFGHSHEVEIERKKDALIINPGECCGVLSGNATFVILETDELSTRVIKL